MEATVNRGRGRRICPCGQGCAPDSPDYKAHLAAYQRQYKADWMRRKREEERAALLERIGREHTAEHPGSIGKGGVPKGVTRLCYCGCGARAGTAEYIKHYNKRYEKLRLMRAASAQRQQTAKSLPIYLAWRGN